MHGVMTMTPQIIQMDAAVRAAGYPVAGFALVKSEHSTIYPSMFFRTPDGMLLRCDWVGPDPGKAIQDDVKAFVADALSKPPQKTPEEKLEALRIKRRAGEKLTDEERDQLLDLLLGV
jgi:hypothetical protein